MATKKYGVVRLDRVRSVYSGHIHSVVKEDGILENGMVGVVGDLLEDERELRKLETPKGTEEPVVLIAHTEINYAQGKITDSALENFFIPQGTPARAYSLEREDIFSVTKEMVTPLASDVVKNNRVVTESGSLLLKEVEEVSLTGTEAFVGKIIDTEKIGTTTIVGQAGAISRAMEFVVIEVIKNRV